MCGEPYDNTKEPDIVSTRIAKLPGEKNFRYFRNAFVRANCNNLQKGIHSATKFFGDVFRQPHA